jgi:hypothetical protein
MIFKNGKVDWNKMKKIAGGLQVSQNHVDNIKNYTKNRMDNMINIVNAAAEAEEKGHAIPQSDQLEPIIDSDSDVYETEHKFKTGDTVDIK